MEYVETLLGDSADKHALWEQTRAEQASEKMVAALQDLCRHKSLVGVDECRSS